MGNIQLNGEEISNILIPLRKKWSTYDRIVKLGSTVLVLGVMAYMFAGMILFRYALRIVIFLPVVIIMVGVFGFLLTRVRKQSDKAEKEYTDTYKRLIAKPILDASFENAHFNPEAGYPREDFKAGALLYVGDAYDYASEDLITGTCRGVAFRRADIKIRHVVGHKHPRTVTDADGRLLEVAFHKNMNGMVRVVKKDEAVLCPDENKRIEMEDMDFNEKFDVYANDRHSAFYLLTPQFMEYMKKLYDRDDKIYITFDGNKLYFLQSGHGGIFEPPEGEFDIRDEVRKCKAELAEIEEIIELLQLDDVAQRETMLRETGVPLQEEAVVYTTDSNRMLFGKTKKKNMGCLIAILILWGVSAIFLILFYSILYMMK